MAKIKVGVIGVGKIGTHHARILSRLGNVELAGVADTNLWRAHLAAWKYKTLAFRDYRDLLPHVEAAVLAVPTPLHGEIGLEVLQRGIHCLIEKPIASTQEEAEKLVEASEQKKALLQIGHVERFNPAILQAIPLIRHPKFISVERLGPYDPRVSHISVVLDLMIHDLDILLSLVPSGVKSLDAVGACLLSDSEDIANARIRFDSGCVADMSASRISMEKSRKIRIFQDDSYLSIDYLHASIKICRKKSPVVKSLKDVAVDYIHLQKTEPLQSQMEHFLQCIRQDREPLVSGEKGMQALKLGLEILQKLKPYRLQKSEAQAETPNWLERLTSGRSQE